MASGTIDIQGIDKAELLAALYNRSKVLGLGALHAKQGDMSLDEARDTIAKHSWVGRYRLTDKGCPPNTPATTIYFDYLHGRVMKVDLAGDTLKTRGYNLDNGEGAAEKIVEAVRAKHPSPVRPRLSLPVPQIPRRSPTR